MYNTAITNLLIVNEIINNAMDICCSQIQLAYNIARFLACYWKYFASQQYGTKIETNIALSYQPFLRIIQRQQLQHFDE